MAQDQRPYFTITASIAIFILLVLLGGGLWLLLKGNPLVSPPIEVTPDVIEASPTGV